ncbi:CRISPR-associated protein Csn2-St [Liquorilactobacillus mali]|uniref:Uncharacterized protein n=1 Tax=Liquorilactobacillus mali TaxID=1618 RepID=A0A0R2FKG7_9LACO|nr:CRISPR-associated protein Csn2-St [Liquorilactobacillus mali]KRN29122.1 hypothetical protein IV36_GL000440 [Liquorilactobacillus mali]MDN7146507.1 CRISPR-associated protein Csn2-St [Liquorilactobacillus mali]
MRVEIEDNKFIEFDEADILFFYGQNQKMAQEFVRSLKRFANKRVLTDLEELVYGENGIEIYRNDQLLKSGSINIHFLQYGSSLFEEVSFEKTSLMTEYLTTLFESIDINIELQKIENHLLKIESLFNQKLKEVSNNISSNVSSLTYTELLKNNIFLSYASGSHNFPLEMMDANEFVDEYLVLLEKSLENNPKETWIALINLASFLTTEKIQVLIDGLVQLAEKTGLIHIFVISQAPLEIMYQPENVPNTMVLADELYQMPDFDSFRNSIENHYPGNLDITDNQLCQRFYEIVAYIGGKCTMTGKSYQDIVLLKVLDEILGFKISNLTYGLKKLTNAERAYLDS